VTDVPDEYGTLDLMCPSLYNTDMPDMTIVETARALGVSERTVRRWIAGGRLGAYRVGGRVRVPERASREAYVPYGSQPVGPEAGPSAASPWPTPDPAVAWLAGPERKAERRRRAIERIKLIAATTLPPRDENDTVEAYIREDRTELDRKWDRLLDLDRP